MSYIPDFLPGFELPADEEIVLGYWKSQAVHWAQMHHERLAQYDLLTGLLEQAYGIDWRRKVAKAADRRQAKGKDAL